MAKHRVGNAAPRLQPLSHIERAKIRQTPETLHAITKREAACNAWHAAAESEKEKARAQYRSIMDKVLGFFKKEEHKLQIANAEASREAQAMRTLQRILTIDEQQPAEAAPITQNPAVAEIEAIVACYNALNDKADRLCAIKETARADFEVESLDLTPLLVAGDGKLSFSESFALLNSTDTVDPLRGAASCINCNLVFNTTKVDRNKDRQHVRTCRREALEAFLDGEYHDLQPSCPMSGCSTRLIRHQDLAQHLWSQRAAAQPGVCGIAKEEQQVQLQYHASVREIHQHRRCDHRGEPCTSQRVTSPLSPCWTSLLRRVVGSWRTR